MALVDIAWYVDFGNGSSTGYYGVTAWAALTTKVCGKLIRQLAAPAVGSERGFVCTTSTTGTGVTSAAEVTWTTTGGAITADTVTLNWQECTGIAALNGDFSANTPLWSNAGIKNSAIVLGQVITNVAGTIVLICTVAGTAGNGTEPTWGTYTTAGETTGDKRGTRTNIGVGGNFPGWQTPHARLANAFTGTWGHGGNSFFVANEHAETQTTALALSAPAGGSGLPATSIYCAAKTPIPPTAVTTGATIAACTTSGNFSVGGSNDYTYWYGVGFLAGSGAVNSSLFLPNNSTCYQYFDNCGFTLNTTYASAINLGGNTGVELVFNNCTWTFGNSASQSFSAVSGTAIVTIIGGSVAVGANVPNPMIVSSSPNLFFKGVDLSAFGSGRTLVGSGYAAGTGVVTFQDCKLGASVTVAAPSYVASNQKVYLIRSDSSGTNYRHEKYTSGGRQVVETTIIRTGGASDGTTGISWKTVTTAYSLWAAPIVCMPISIWNTSTSAITTLTIYGTTTGGGVPNDDQIWIDVEYLGSGSFPQGSVITSTKVSNLAGSAAVNNSSDGSTWGGGGAGNGFKIVCPSFTPGMAGPINITVKVAKASSTYYIDPKPSISGVTVSKSEILAPGVYANERSTGGMLTLSGMTGGIRG